jgi:exodeoxyribonuclease VIII
MATLEPDDYAAKAFTYEKIDGRTKEGKAQRTELELVRAEGMLPVTMDDDAAIRQIRAGVFKNPIARRMIGESRELTLEWQDPDTHVDCKCRIDSSANLSGMTFVADIKTSRDARKQSFQRDIHNYLYHFQAAFYIDGFRAVFNPGPEMEFVFIGVEKSAPFATACYQLESEAVQYGRTMYKRALAQYRKCADADEWPAYQQTEQEMLIGLPKWAGEEPPLPFGQGDDE